MQATEWLRIATAYLSAQNIATARLDALVLLEDILQVDRASILAEPSMLVPEGAVAALQNVLNRRARHEPLAYIRGRTEFYGRDFKVSPAVLVPRPESETMIDLLKSLTALPPHPRIADIGTGSGALGITATLELPKAEVDLVEIDPSAAKIAFINVVSHATANLIIMSDLLSNLTKAYDILLCNLPYVPDDYQVNHAAQYEPSLALFAGTDGLDLYRQLFFQLASTETRPLYILSEAFPNQHDALATLAATAGYKLVKVEDFIQLFEL